MNNNSFTYFKTQSFLLPFFILLKQIPDSMYSVALLFIKYEYKNLEYFAHYHIIE